MNLEQLISRVQEIETAIVNTNIQLNALHGHKGEVQYWIQQIKAKEQEENAELIEADEVAVV